MQGHKLTFNKKRIYDHQNHIFYKCVYNFHFTISWEDQVPHALTLDHLIASKNRCRFSNMCIIYSNDNIDLFQLSNPLHLLKKQPFNTPAFLLKNYMQPIHPLVKVGSEELIEYSSAVMITFFCHSKQKMNDVIHDNIPRIGRTT